MSDGVVVQLSWEAETRGLFIFRNPKSLETESLRWRSELQVYSLSNFFQFTCCSFYKTVFLLFPLLIHLSIDPFAGLFADTFTEHFFYWSFYRALCWSLQITLFDDSFTGLFVDPFTDHLIYWYFYKTLCWSIYRSLNLLVFNHNI